MPYVSRGGIKLAHALDTFAVDVAGAVALDVGASTGGFTDCLLQRGAARVYCVDVGVGQLDWKIASDARVRVHRSGQHPKRRARSAARTGRRGGHRRLLHLFAAGAAGAAAAGETGRAGGGAGEAAVRGGTGRRGQGGDRSRRGGPRPRARRGARRRRWRSVTRRWATRFRRSPAERGTWSCSFTCGRPAAHP